MNNVDIDLETLDMAALLTQYPVPRPPARHALVRGTVILANHYGYYVDIGLKSESFVTDAGEDLAVGETYLFMVVSSELDDDGAVRLSYRRAERWDRLIQLSVSGESTIAVVKSIARSKKTGNVAGLYAIIDGVRGFVPRSELYCSLTKIEEIVGTEIPVKVKTVDPEAGRNGNLILSQKAAFDDLRADAIESFKDGDVVAGEVIKSFDYGVLVQIHKDIVGLAYRTELSRRSPADFRVGQEVTVKILKRRPEEGKVTLSIQ